MGRSAKFAKRPNKAEKVARQINKPITSHNDAQRSLSPEIEGEKSAIPLFNTSAKNRLSEHHTKPDPRLTSSSSTTMVDDEGDSEEPPELVEALDSEAGLKPTKKSMTAKEKVRAANQALEKDGKRTERKLGEKYRKGGKEHILGGKDYVKMLESRPSGKFGHKKLR